MAEPSATHPVGAAIAAVACPQCMAEAGAGCSDGGAGSANVGRWCHTPRLVAYRREAMLAAERGYLVAREAYEDLRAGPCGSPR